MERPKNIAWRNFGLTLAFAALVLCLGLFGCAENIDSDSGDISLIVGTWKANAECYETYTYNEDDTFSIRSDSRVLTGTYSFAADATSDELYRLTLNVASDTPDDAYCHNNAWITEEGVMLDFYVSFTNKNQTHALYSLDKQVIVFADREDLSGEIGM